MTLQQQADVFMTAHKGVYADSTYIELIRRLRRINSELAPLGIPDDYTKITFDHVREYAVFIRSKGISQKALNHDLSTLGRVCRFYGNSCVDRARSKYPLIFRTPTRSRLPPLSPHEVDALICGIESITAPFNAVRAGATTLLALGAGLRTIELQHAEMANLDTQNWILTLSVVKGNGTYGQSRTVPIMPVVRPYLTYYLAMRTTQPPTISESRYVFSNPISGAPLVTNSLRHDRDKIASLTGVDYDYRKLRRTYGQALVNAGVPIEAVSRVMGHNNTVTTEKHYAQLPQDTAIFDVKSVWGEICNIPDLREKYRIETGGF